jgi:Holliday junction DNA helicase RuvB
VSKILEIGDVTPTSLSHLVGQSPVKDQIRVALDAAHQDGKKFDHALLTGPPGTGKTQTAKVIALEMAADFQEVLGQSVQSSADLNALLLAAKDRDVILVDEAHELDREYQTALYLALDQRKVILPCRGRTPQSIPLADFTLLLATTDEFKLLQPIRDRMRLGLRFGFYSLEELADLTRQRAVSLGWGVDAMVFAPIAARSRGTPRLALRLLQAARRVCRADGDERITEIHLERACQLEELDNLGLGPPEQQYLATLTGTGNRLNVIASRLSLPVRTVAEVIEPFLLRTGLIEKDDQGRRQLTVEGRDHILSNSRKIVV